MIPSIPFITATVRPLNERFHHLITREQDGTITPDETDELDGLCEQMENGLGGQGE